MLLLMFYQLLKINKNNLKILSENTLLFKKKQFFFFLKKDHQIYLYFSFVFLS